MSIRNPEELKEAIKMAINGDDNIISDIGDYITYNYYIYLHTKPDTDRDRENEKIYEEFKINHPNLFLKV
jgi:hypothetical protein